MANSYALNFNGSSRIVFGRDTMNATNTLTLEFWMNVASSDYSVYRSIVSNRDGSSATANYEVGLIVNSGNMFFYNGTVYDMGYKPPINTWVHIAYKVVNSTLSFYINGALSKTVTGVALGRSTSMDFAIGAISSGGIQPFIGKIDDVRLWNIEKSSDQIMNNYKKNLSGAEDGLIGYFPFEEGTGTQTVNKKLGSSLIGSIVSPNWITAEVELYSNKFLISSEDQYYSNPFVPKETAIPAQVAPSAKVFSSPLFQSSVYFAYRAFDGIDSITPFLGAGTSGFLGYEFDKPIIIRGYAIRSYVQSNSDLRTALPKDWTFEGSNDGTNWTVLDTRVNQIWSIPATEEKEYNISPSELRSFKFYRINWTTNNGYANYTAINELKMYKSGKLIKSKEMTEQIFVSYGMNKQDSLNLSDILVSYDIIEGSYSLLGSGKVFKQKIDTSKIPIKKASIT